MSRSRRVKKEVQKELFKIKALHSSTKKKPDENGKFTTRLYHRLYEPLYRPDYCYLVGRAAEEGMNLREFAAKIEVNPKTLWNWAERYPEFRDAIEVAKAKLEAFWWEMARKQLREKFRFELFQFMIAHHIDYGSRHFYSDGNESQEVRGGIVFLPESKPMEKILEEESQAEITGGYIEQSTVRRNGGDLEAAEDPEKTA